MNTDYWRGEALRDLVERLEAARDVGWHVLKEEPNYVWRADRANTLRQKAKREGLNVEIRARNPTIELRLTRQQCQHPHATH